jgi:hypothetical protein
MDVGNDVRRSRGSRAVAKLADTVQGMMGQWTEDNFSQFEETMKLIKEGAPVQWVKLYMEAVKLGIEKNTNINININRQKDRDDLQALVRSRISLPDSGSYTPYEEVKPQELSYKERRSDATDSTEE